MKDQIAGEQNDRSPGPHPQKRRIKNFLINPGAQFRLFVPFLAMLGMASILINILVLKISSDIYGIFPEMSPDQMAALTQMMTSSVLMTSVGLFIMAVAGFALTSILSHRILGPLVPISRHVQALKGGNYSSRIRLRNRDELKSLAEELNDLAKTLDEKK